MSILSQTSVNPDIQKIAIEWQKAPLKGTIEVLNGKLLKIEVIKYSGLYCTNNNH